jgi:uncharacterized membrane protein
MTILKKLLRIGVFISLGIILYGIVKTTINKTESKNVDLNLEEYGVIDSVKVSSDRATPSYYINYRWMYLHTFGRSIIPFVQVGDSISKTKGDNLLYVYRKNEKGDYLKLKEVESW